MNCRPLKRSEQRSELRDFTLCDGFVDIASLVDTDGLHLLHIGALLQLVTSFRSDLQVAATVGEVAAVQAGFPFTEVEGGLQLGDEVLIAFRSF